jgi:hypothetical protein
MLSQCVMDRCGSILFHLACGFNCRFQKSAPSLSPARRGRTCRFFKQSVIDTFNHCCVPASHFPNGN